jgi:mannose-6-phosphate isomerase-like protein (cupin superfamily)
MRIRRAAVAVTALASILSMGSASAQRAAPMTAWAPQPEKLAPFQAPNTLYQPLGAVLAKHKGQKNWSQTMILDRDYIAQYIQMAPGEKTKTQFWADDRIFWVVQSGAIRFTIEGQEPFVATKGFLVQVPYRVPYSMETVGDEPALRFEVRAAHEMPSYPTTETPPKDGKWNYIRATYTGKGKYDDANKPYLDFQKTIVEGGGKGGGFVRDDHTWANVIRGAAAPLPPDTSWGHFHENFAEFWIVLEGEEDFLIQGEKLVRAHTGDIVFAPEERWHRATHNGPIGTMSTRLAITPRPPSLHYYQPGSAGGD